MILLELAKLLEVGNLKYEWIKQFEWPGTLKDQTTFGQLPFFVDGDLKICQSMAIARYISRKAGLQGDNDADFAISEQLIEEQGDLYTTLAKAQYHPSDKPGAWKEAFEKTIPNGLSFFEKLLKGDFFGSKLTAGDVAVFSIVNTILDVKADALASFPKLQAHYNRIAALPGVDNYLKNSGVTVYFKPVLA